MKPNTSQTAEENGAEAQGYDSSNREERAPLTKRTRSKKSESAFRTISEVADELDVQQHVLRFWETKFSQVKPLKRGGGRRYYRPEDVELLKAIHNLLYTEGYTIKGVQKLLREQGKNAVVTQNSEPEVSTAPSPANSSQTAAKGLNDYQKDVLRSMLSELKELRGIIAADE